MTRYRIEVLGDIYAIENRIASNRKTAANTLNVTSAQIADATLGSLTRRLEALRAELAMAPERPAHNYHGVSFRFTERTTPITLEENAALEIPAFLRRQ